MNKEEIELLKEMRDNCLSANIYDDKKRLLKASTIDKVLRLLDKYENLIKHLKELDLYEFELDYDYEENPIDNYYPFNLSEEIENWLNLESEE